MDGYLELVTKLPLLGLLLGFPWKYWMSLANCTSQSEKEVIGGGQGGLWLADTGDHVTHLSQSQLSLWQESMEEAKEQAVLTGLFYLQYKFILEGISEYIINYIVPIFSLKSRQLGPISSFLFSCLFSSLWWDPNAWDALSGIGYIMNTVLHLFWSESTDKWV